MRHVNVTGQIFCYHKKVGLCRSLTLKQRNILAFNDNILITYTSHELRRDIHGYIAQMSNIFYLQFNSMPKFHANVINIIKINVIPHASFFLKKKTPYIKDCFDF